MHQISPRIRELLREGAERALNLPPDWQAEIDAAAVNAAGTRDPVAVATIRRTSRLNLLHWASSTMRAPGEPVPPNLSSEMIQALRGLARRGTGEAVLNAYRSAAWLRWMEIVFGLTSDPEELRLLLDVSARSIAAYVDATITALSDHMKRERADLLRGSTSERRALVQLILDRHPIDPQAVSRSLGYRLDQTHQAAVIWSEEPDPDTGLLDNMGKALIAQMGRRPVLTIAAGRGTFWLWLPRPLTPEAFEATCPRSIYVALGPPARDLDGFRRSHQRAKVAQQILSTAPLDRRVVTYDMVRLMSALTPNREALHDFIADTLGDLAGAKPKLREVLLIFLSLGSNAARAAEALNVHRNTLMRHILKAESLLPRPLDASRLQVAVALETLRWNTLDDLKRSARMTPASSNKL
jgi:DNA-binding PucR family transcriptional regulator